MLNATDVFRIEYFVKEYKRYQSMIEEGNYSDMCDFEGNIDAYTSIVVGGENGWRTSYCFLEIFEATEGINETDEGIFEAADELMGIIGEQLNKAVSDVLSLQGIEMQGSFYIGYSESDGDIAIFYTQEVHRITEEEFAEEMGKLI